MSVNTKMTALADEIRELSGTADKLGLDAMADSVGSANAEVASQEELIASIMSALDGKALSGTINITVDANGLITAKGGDRVATHQLAFQPATTITPSSTSQVAVSSGHYTGGDVMIAGDSNLTAENIKAGTSIFGVNGTAESADEVMDKVYNRSFTEVGNSMLSQIGSYAFANCSNLTLASFPNASRVYPYAFGYCSKLTTVNLPKISRADNQAFYNCKMLKSINLPELLSAGIQCFGYCSSLTSINLPKVTSFSQGYIFADCYEISTLNFPNLSSIGAYTFSKCYRLSSLTLGASSICTLSNSNAFSSTPYAGYSSYFSGTPYIYVPASLVDAYKTATNWTYFSKYFSAF